MCYHNYTSHNGCGHIGESYTQPWTLCDKALQRLSELRGPNSPPLSPQPPSFATPKRASSTRRFFSLNSVGNTLSRSNTSATMSSRRTTSGPPQSPRASTSSYGSYMSAGVAALNYSTLPDHQLLAVKCATPMKRTHVSREMDVCKVCKAWLENVRSMLGRYDKTGNIKGTLAFEKFLKGEGDGAGEDEVDLTVPLEDNVNGVGARQAIVLGHPESALSGDMVGLEALERELNQRRGFFD